MLLFRFETFHMMKKWIVDINNEAHSIHSHNEEQVDWWSTLFQDIKPLDIKSNVPRRDAHYASTDDFGESPSKHKTKPHRNSISFTKSKSKKNQSTEEEPNELTVKTLEASAEHDSDSEGEEGDVYTTETLPNSREKKNFRRFFGSLASDSNQGTATAPAASDTTKARSQSTGTVGSLSISLMRETTEMSITDGISGKHSAGVNPHSKLKIKAVRTSCHKYI